MGLEKAATPGTAAADAASIPKSKRKAKEVVGERKSLRVRAKVSRDTTEQERKGRKNTGAKPANGEAAAAATSADATASAAAAAAGGDAPAAAAGGVAKDVKSDAAVTSPKASKKKRSGGADRYEGGQPPRRASNPFDHHLISIAFCFVLVQ